MTKDKDKRYLHKQCEVKLTGRRASRMIGKAGGRNAQKLDIQHEITPCNTEDGTWSDWVKLKELYEISSTEHTGEQE